MSGRIAYYQQTEEMLSGLNISTVSIAGLADGAYIIRLTTDNGAYTSKIVKGK